MPEGHFLEYLECMTLDTGRNIETRQGTSHQGEIGLLKSSPMLHICTRVGLLRVCFSLATKGLFIKVDRNI